MEKPIYQRVTSEGYQPTQDEIEHMAMDLSKALSELDELRCDMRRGLEDLLDKLKGL